MAFDKDNAYYEHDSDNVPMYLLSYYHRGSCLLLRLVYLPIERERWMRHTNTQTVE